MSTKKISLTTFVRKQLKAKGTTEHWGRGFYVCGTSNLTNQEVTDKVKALLPTWKEKGLVLDEQVDEESGRVNVLFVTGVFSSEHYRILSVGVDFPFGDGYSVNFCMGDTIKLS